ncbi:MAG TPA: hypothetical protein VMS60_12310 [Solirubrobacterales bacterium]|nr:hypothetical protein [Solirubrobacterales bacterium]
MLLPLALAIGVFAVSAPGASALVETHYGGFVLSPGQTLSSGVARTDITGNIAAYTGEGSVNVCQRTFDNTTGIWHEGCGTNGVGNALNLMPYHTNSLTPHIMNNSGFSHTIHGWWYRT